MADANKTSIVLGLQTDFATPATGAVGYEFLPTSETIGFSQNSITSERLRADRQIDSLVRTSIQAQGSLAFELSYGMPFDDMFQAGLMDDGTLGTWTSGLGSSGSLTGDPTITVAAANQVTRDAGDWVADGYAVGDIVVPSGFGVANAAFDGKAYYVGAVTTTVIALAGPVLNIDAVGAQGFSLDGADGIANGITDRFWTVEKGFVDAAAPGVSLYETYQSMMIDTMAVTATPEQMVTGEFTFLGKAPLSSGTTPTLTVDDPAKKHGTDPIMNSVETNSFMLVGGQAQVGIADFAFTLNNNGRIRPEVFTFGATDIGTGTVQVDGTANIYVANNTLYDIAAEYQDKSMTAFIYDQAGNQFIFNFPQVKFGDLQRQAGGQNQDVVNAITWQAARETGDLNKTIRIFRAPAV